MTVSPSKCVYSLVGYLHVFRIMGTDLEKSKHLDLQDGHLELDLEKAFLCVLMSIAVKQKRTLNAS